jgi:integrase
MKRVKGSEDFTHTLRADESRALHRMPKLSQYVFTSAAGRPLTDEAFRKMLAAAGRSAGLGQVNPHILRHSCGAYYAGGKTCGSCRHGWGTMSLGTPSDTRSCRPKPSRTSSSALWVGWRMKLHAGG